jgi:hypothetical protein
MSKEESSYNSKMKDPSCDQINIISYKITDPINNDISNTNKINLETTQEEYLNAPNLIGKTERSKQNLLKFFIF